MSGTVTDIVLTEADIPGASLQEPLKVHHVADLKWWLLCRGVQVSSSCKKPGPSCHILVYCKNFASSIEYIESVQ